MHVTIGVITYQRGEALRELLASLARQTFNGAAPTIELLIVDNDAKASACRIVDEVEWDMPYPVRYIVEPRAGIPFARNRVVAEMRRHSQALAFIDDDETADPTWLAELLRVQRAYDADVVSGPVLREFDETTPAWVTQGTLFNRPRFETGTLRPTADTGNVLTMAHLFKVFDPPFDESIGQAGGSDREFYGRVYAAGYTIVYANDAMTRERVPAERATARWVLRRSYHGGNQLALQRLKRKGGVITRVRLVGRAMRSWFKGVLLLPLAIIQGKRGGLRAVWHLCNGAGVLAGLRGRRLDQYARQPDDARRSA